MKNKKKFFTYRGRTSLNLIIEAIGIVSGSFIAVQSFTCSAVLEAILESNCTPIFIDTEKDKINICTKDLVKKIQLKKIKCIIIQHTYGSVNNLEQIIEISKKYKIKIIEDCCHSIYSKHLNKYVGNFGVASFYSFEFGKPLVLGIGGMCFFNSKEAEINAEKIYQNYKIPNVKENILIFLQFIFFLVLNYNFLYWTNKKIFKILTKKNLIIGNFQKNKKEFKKKSVFHIKKLFNFVNYLYFNSIEKHKVLFKEKYDLIKNYNSKVIFPFNYSNNYIIHNIPIIVKNKKKTISFAKKHNIKILSYFETQIHPYKNYEIKKFTKELDSCKNSKKLAEQIILIPVSVSNKHLKYILNKI